MAEINFSLALNKPHKSKPEGMIIWNPKEAHKIKKLSDCFFTKEKSVITNQELHPDKFRFEGVDFVEIEKKQSQCTAALTIVHGFIDFIPDWRFIVGLGGASVYETGITLHHIYGIPYIPASSIKGSTRSWRILEDDFKKQGEDSEGLAIETNEEFCRVFGCPKKLDVKGFREYKSILKHKGESSEFEGEIVFFDAFPLTAPKIKVDIMNPHYQPYYDDKKGKTPPADYHSPVPINFLTVENTVFRMYFGVKKEKSKELLPTVKKWLAKALFERGIGAKTAVGYGYNKFSETQEAPIDLAPKTVTPDFFNKPLKINSVIEGELIKTGNVDNVKLFIKEGNTPIVSFNYGKGGFEAKDIGKIGLFFVKNLGKGGAVDKTVFGFQRFK